MTGPPKAKRPGGHPGAAAQQRRQPEHDNPPAAAPQDAQLQLPLSWPPRPEPDRDDGLPDDWELVRADFAELYGGGEP